jgi:glycosyltransferase involved in cell wall biosynthesis
MRLDVPFPRLREERGEILITNRVAVMHPRIDVPVEYRQPRSAADYEVIEFLLVGDAADGRNGQMIALVAFQELLKRHITEKEATYREFGLTLVGLGDDFISEQLRTIGAAVMGKRLKIHRPIAPEAELEVMRGCNAVISCALDAGDPPFVAEGMAMGHVVLRNGTGGQEEQPGQAVNGYSITTGDIARFVDVLEEMLNRDKTPSSALQAMGRASQELIDPEHHQSYLERPVEGSRT